MRAPALRQVDSDGWALTRGVGGREEAWLVDFGGRLRPAGARRLAALLLAAPPPGLTALDLRFSKGHSPDHSHVVQRSCCGLGCPSCMLASAVSEP